MADLENLIDINSDPIFETAFTHRSYLNESTKEQESNERLEFLGDAVLSLIISSYIYKRRTDQDEGYLTNLRSYIVKTTSLAKIAKILDLGRRLKLSKGEELSGGRENPQLLANTYEALVGAIFLSKGLDEAKKFIEDSLLPLFEEEIKSGPPKDAKSQLQEVAQFKTKQSPKYKILRTEGPDHNRKFTVGVFVSGEQLGVGEGFSKQLAEEMAANEALEKMLD